MKKSVILTIVIVYIVSIIAVGFYGASLKVYNPEIYAESVECKTDGYIKYKEGSDGANQGFDGYILIPFKKGKESVINLICDVTPANVTTSGVVFNCVENAEFYFKVNNTDGTATFTFKKTGTLTVNVESADKKAKIKLQIIIVDESIYDSIKNGGK